MAGYTYANFMAMSGSPVVRQVDGAQRLLTMGGFDITTLLEATSSTEFPIGAAIATLHALPLGADASVFLHVLHNINRVSGEGDLMPLQGLVVAVCERLIVSAHLFPVDSQRRVVGVVSSCLSVAGLRRVLTPVHISLLQWALAARHFQQAADFAAEPVLDIQPDFAASANAGVGAEVCTYLFLCGTALACMRTWGAAAEAYRTCFALGAKDMKQEALPKWLLCCLIAYGKVSSAPKYITSHVPAYRLEQSGLHRAYLALARASEQEDTGAMHAAAAEAEALFAHDGNSVLVSELVRRTLLARVSRLGDTYNAVSLKQVSTALAINPAAAPWSEEETKAFLLSSFAIGQLQATLDEAGGRLTFSSSSSSYLSGPFDDKAVAALRADVEQAQELIEDMKAADRLTTLQIPVLTKLLAVKKEGGRLGLGMGLGWGRRDAVGAGGSGGVGAFGGWNDTDQPMLDTEDANWGGFGAGTRAGRGPSHGRATSTGLSEEQQLAWALQDSLARQAHMPSAAGSSRE